MPDKTIVDPERYCIPELDISTFLSIINIMYDELLIYNNNYKIVYINRACARHYSCTPEHMIGKSFFDFVGLQWWEPSILPIVYKEKKAYAIKQKTFIGSELLTIAVPLFNQQGDIQYVVMNVRDTINDIDLYNPQYIYTEHKPSSSFDLVAESDEMKQVISLVKKVGPVDVTCIFFGESGTGKTMIAKYLHSLSSRRDESFISLNCANIPSELLETELFGYVRGAFTGASSTGKKGLLEAANHGTLLLDEIAELTMAAQAKLLQVLQDKSFFPLGSSRAVTVDTRIIAATNKNLKDMIKTGQFREDLYYRLNVVDIYIPPLRRRKRDIIPLIYHFLNHYCMKHRINRQLTETALNIMSNYEWPGNVRELSHVMERLVVTVDSLSIDAIHLPRNLFGIIDFAEMPKLYPTSGEPFEKTIQRYEALVIQEAFQKCRSSRKMAEYLSISQSRANNLIRKYVKT